LVTFQETCEAQQPLNTVNVAVAAYTTAGARLELYKYLDILQKRVLCFVTDSVIFTQSKDEPSLPLGDFLGDLTDELIDYGHTARAIQFVSGGPKNYSLEIHLPDSNDYLYLTKAKGFTLNFRNAQKINFDSMKRLVFATNDADDDDDADDNNRIITTDSRIIRKGVGCIFTKFESKIYKINIGKRKMIDNFNTLPWGHI
jgi:hypothetical protein